MSNDTRQKTHDCIYCVVDLHAPQVAHTIGGPLTQTTFTFDPVLPSYDILNLRLGVRHGIWDVALFVNNVFDERALK